MLDFGQMTQVLEDLDVDPERIKGVHNALEKLAGTLETSPFVTRPLNPVFGASTTADSLELHHAKARLVIEDTVLGVVSDLQRFATGVQRAVTLVDDADLTNAQQLQAKQRGVELLVASTSFSDADRRNDQSRNENGGTDT